MFDKAGDWVETNFMPVERVPLSTDFLLGAHLGGTCSRAFPPHVVQWGFLIFSCFCSLRCTPILDFLAVRSMICELQISLEYDAQCGLTPIYDRWI